MRMLSVGFGNAPRKTFQAQRAFLFSQLNLTFTLPERLGFSLCKLYRKHDTFLLSISIFHVVVQPFRNC